MTRAYRIRDWRLPDASELTPEQAKARMVTVEQKPGEKALSVQVETLDGKVKHEVLFELDKGFLRVRAYATNGPDEPIGELWLNDTGGVTYQEAEAIRSASVIV